ncbi:uncharacterized protein LOC128866813 [Anastrepha ludens]|uniref:uncharacterized protein LOC128866813 n=1 Tax=Anastrepha ludens TaxID=28586 RepID=UPI0023AFC51A|nr:uncharacterized protein LOC128866813 [Anastrepha ludens]
MPTMRLCIAGCPTLGITVHKFPPETDATRRELWLRQFGQNPALYSKKLVFACRRHFSNEMKHGNRLQKDAYPDVNLRKYDKNLPYIEKFGEFGEEPNLQIEYATIPYKMPVTAFSDSEVVDNLPSRASVESNMKDQKRQCILKCTSRHVLHILPSMEKELERRKKWLYLLAKDPDLYPQKYVYVCDDHFDTNMRCLTKLIRGACPNKNLPPPLQKSIPTNMEAKTDCFQKCTDYKRKYRFPSLQHEGQRRQIWLRKFGRDPALYNHEIYACDRHFSDQMRIGPFLRREAIPDQNLMAKVLHETENNNVSFVSKKWSLQRLNALAKCPARPAAPCQKSKDIIQKLIDVENRSVSTPPEEPPQKDNIINRANMNLMPPTNQTEHPHTPEEHVKMHTLGVFLPKRDGYVVSVDQILSAEDPLDIEKYQPFDWFKPIEPELPMDVHIIQKEAYEENTSDGELSDAATELSDAETKSTFSAREATSESDEDMQICGKRKIYSEAYENRKKLKLAQTQSVTNDLVAAKSANLVDSYAKPARHYFPEITDQTKELPATHDSADKTGVRVCSVLEQLAAAYPTESFSILMDKDNTVVEYRKETNERNNADDIITPDAPKITDDTEKINSDIADREDDRSFISTSVGSSLTAQPRITQEKALQQNTTTASVEKFLKLRLQQQNQQGRNEQTVTNAVALAESWQQVIKTIEKKQKTNKVKNSLSETGTTAPKLTESSPNLAEIKRETSDKFADVVSRTNGEKVNAGGRAALHINGKTTTAGVVPAKANCAQVVGNCGNTIKKNNRAVTRAAQDFEDLSGPQTTNTEAAMSIFDGKIEIFESEAERIRETQFEDETSKQISKLKNWLNTNHIDAPSNPTKDVVHNQPPTTNKNQQGNVKPSKERIFINLRYCILKCESFRKLYAFPSHEVEPKRRRFWFLELGLDLACDWLKQLYICDNHFEPSMLAENNKLKQCAYPRKTSVSPAKLGYLNAGTQTDGNAEQNNAELLRELNELKELDSQQAKEITRIKVLIRLKQEAARLIAEIESCKEEN